MPSQETLAVGKMENCFRDASDYVERFLTDGVGQTSGAAAMATLHLAARTLADLRSGQFLVSSGLVIQMASVVRPALESLNLIELFEQEPEAAERWAAGEWREFMPAKVRERLGEKDDPVYSWLSEVSHPRFAGFQITTYRIVRADAEAEADEENHEASLYIGGLPLELPPVMIAVRMQGHVLCQLGLALRFCHVKEEVAWTWPTVARQIVETLVPGYEAITTALRERGDAEEIEMAERMLEAIYAVLETAREAEKELPSKP
jgi:hypothetical protein